MRRAFTLIELLIVVAIIAILAAIAMANFLEAQTRGKASRVKAELRTVATALEAYCVDYNTYPLNDGLYNVLPIEITTPVAYISESRLVDPFSTAELHPFYGLLARFYTYDKIVDFDGLVADCALSRCPPFEAVDDPNSAFNPGAFQKYGKWRLVSNGPDKTYSELPPAPRFAADQPLYGSDIPYDPTNGTTSWGNLLRTQNSVEGVVK